MSKPKLGEPPFTVGIEEEYLLVNRATGDLDNDPRPSLLKECTDLGGGQGLCIDDGLLQGGSQCDFQMILRHDDI